MREPILTKEQNYRLWQNGEFGNKLRAWRTINEWRLSGFRGKVALRQVSEGGGGRCSYDIDPADVVLAIARWDVEGIPLDSIMINEMSPHAEILQGEYLNGVREDGLWGHFFYSHLRARMRDALRKFSSTTHGLRSDLLLRAVMTPSSYSDWQVPLERYPDHVLEVSIYDRCVGDIPGRNALVWEVRRY